MGRTYKDAKQNRVLEVCQKTGWHIGTSPNSIEVLSDTKGVDFGPYLQDILVEIKNSWYRLISGRRGDEEREARD